MREKSFALPKTNWCGEKNNTTSETAEIINVLVRNPITGGCYLRVLCYKRKTTSWKICLRGMVPWEPKSGIVLISTNQNRIFLDLVLDKVQMFPLHAPELGKRRELEAFLLLSWQPRVPPKHAVSHASDESPMCLTAHWPVGKAGILYPYGLIT